MPDFRRIGRQLEKRGLDSDTLLGGAAGEYARGVIGVNGSGNYAAWATGGMSAGIPITPATMNTIPAVWQAVNIYANTIASLDLFIAAGNVRGGHQAAPEHPVYKLVHSTPNSYTTSYRFRQALIFHCLTYGNAYAEIEWDARGRQALALHLIDPRNVTIGVANGEVVYRVNNQDADEGYLPSSDILHFAQVGFDGVTGYSPARLFSESLGLMKAREVYQASLYGNGAVPSGFLKSPHKADPKRDADLRAAWKEIHGGARNAGEVAVLSGGLEWVQTQYSPEAMNVIGGLNFSVADVARIFNLPQHMLGILDKSTFSNMEQQQIQFYQLSLLPWLTMIEQEINAKLFGPIERGRYFARHNISTLLRGDMAGRAAYHTAMFNIGVLSQNEIRVEDGLNPRDDPGADYHWVPVNNLQAVELMGATQVEESAYQLDPDIPPPDDTITPPADDQPPTPAPKGSILDTEGLTALRTALADPIGRMTRRESQAVRKAARRPESNQDLSAWADGFYRDHARLVAEAISPALGLVRTFAGRDLDPQDVAARLVATHRDRLRDLTVTVPPDELPDAVDRTCTDWETTDFASALLTETTDS